MAKQKNTHRNTKGRADILDALVGARIRNRRALLGITQKGLGEQIDVTFQQVQKYETGANRIGAGRLCHIAHVLDVPISYFFEDIDDYTIKKHKPNDAILYANDILDRPASIRLLRTFWHLPEDARKNILRLIEAIIGQDE